MRKRLVATLVGGLALVPALATAPAACFPQGQCAFSSADYCGPTDTACHGHLIDPYTWESGPIDGSWMDFRHDYNITAHLRDAVTGQSIQGSVYEYLAYISPDPAPIADANQFALAGGNLAEWVPQPDGVSVILRNDTCADYFVYFIVRAAPNGSPDAGTDAATDGASLDATTD